MSNGFSKNLKFWREHKKLSHLEMAAAVGVGRSTYSTWESAAACEPSYDKLIRLSDYFGITVDQLIREPGAMKKVA